MVPPFDWGVYGENGFFPKKPIDHSVREVGPLPSITPQNGAGGRFPVMVGPSANVQARQWLIANGLNV